MQMGILSKLMLCSSRYVGVSTLSGAICRGLQQPGGLILTAAIKGEQRHRQAPCLHRLLATCVRGLPLLGDLLPGLVEGCSLGQICTRGPGILSTKPLGLAVPLHKKVMLCYVNCLPVSQSKMPHQDVPGFVWQESSSCKHCLASPLTVAGQLLQHVGVLSPACSLHIQRQLPTKQHADCASRNVLKSMLSCSP